MIALKKRGFETTKDALYVAVEHYLKCPYAGREEELFKDTLAKKLAEKEARKERKGTLEDFL